MARNEEKAQAMLNRFVAAKTAANKEDKSSRPYLATDCTDLADCERYRNQIIREVSKKVSLIQNEGLDEHRVRDLNDAINKLMREKGHWERQIKSLGGPDYFRSAPSITEDAEEVVPGKGYRYYGAAKKLPGVKELFSKPAPERLKRTRFEMMKGIDADYYGACQPCRDPGPDFAPAAASSARSADSCLSSIPRAQAIETTMMGPWSRSRRLRPLSGSRSWCAHGRPTRPCDERRTQRASPPRSATLRA